LVKEVAMGATADTEFSDVMHGRWSGLVRLSFGLTGDLQLAEDLAQTASITQALTRVADRRRPPGSLLWSTWA
jgi:hypothetical protein